MIPLILVIGCSLFVGVFVNSFIFYFCCCDDGFIHYSDYSDISDIDDSLFSYD